MAVSMMVGCLVAYAGATLLFGAFMVGFLFPYASSGSERSSPDFRGVLHATLGMLKRSSPSVVLPSIGFLIPFSGLWKDR
jgi:hypothetical protein